MKRSACLLALLAIATASPAFAQSSSNESSRTQLPGRFQLELSNNQSGFVTKFESPEEETDQEATTPSIQQHVPPNAVTPRVQVATSPRPFTPAPRATIKDGRDD